MSGPAVRGTVVSYSIYKSCDRVLTSPLCQNCPVGPRTRTVTRLSNFKPSNSDQSRSCTKRAGFSLSAERQLKPDKHLPEVSSRPRRLSQHLLLELFSWLGAHGAGSARPEHLGACWGISGAQQTFPQNIRMSAMQDSLVHPYADSAEQHE